MVRQMRVPGQTAKGEFKGAARTKIGAAQEWVLTRYDHTQAAPEIRRRFVDAVREVGRARPSNSEKIRLYALYKQAAGANAPSTCPRAFDVVRIAKWEAWHSVRGKSSAEAMDQYAQLVEALIERDDADGAEPSHSRKERARKISREHSDRHSSTMTPGMKALSKLDFHDLITFGDGPWWTGFTRGTVPDKIGSIFQKIRRLGRATVWEEDEEETIHEESRSSLARRDSGDLGIVATEGLAPGARSFRPAGAADDSARESTASADGVAAAKSAKSAKKGKKAKKGKAAVRKAKEGRRGSLHPMLDASTPFAGMNLALAKDTLARSTITPKVGESDRGSLARPTDVDLRGSVHKPGGGSP